MADNLYVEHLPPKRSDVEPSRTAGRPSPQAERLAHLGRTLNGASAVVAQRQLAERLNQGAADRMSGARLPSRLKAGIEALSGVSMSDVRVHHRSDKPAQLRAEAFAQGNDIHLGPGQERHLPHEAWHVAQQKNGRVRPTMRAETGTAINDDVSLEQEADRMGREASVLALGAGPKATPVQRRSDAAASGAAGAVVQRQIVLTNGPAATSDVVRREAARRDSNRVTAIMSVYGAWASDGEVHTYDNLVALVRAIIAHLRSIERTPDAIAASSDGLDETTQAVEGGHERTEAAVQGSEPRSSVVQGPSTSSTTSGGSHRPGMVSRAPGRDVPSRQPPSRSRLPATASGPVRGGLSTTTTEPPASARAVSGSQRSGPRQSSASSRASGRSATATRTERRVEPQPAVSAEQLPMHATGTPPEMHGEDHTRVGFEIEHGWHMLFPLDQRSAIDGLTNETLAECTINGVPVLEMLLDDVGRRGDQTDAQVEFRTRPLEFDDIDGTLAQNIRFAITNFPRDYLRRPRELRFERPLDNPPTGRQAGRTAVNTARSNLHHVIVWRPTDTLRSNDALLASGSLVGSYNLPPVLAQHASTTIEMTAYASEGVDDEQRRRLYPHAVAARSEQDVVDRIDTRIRNQLHSSGQIKATTKGRNDERFTVKSPIESILAADPSLRRPPGVGGPRGVFIGERYQYPLRDVVETATEIQRRGTFPRIQGENRRGGQGFRAVAEKLQAPLRDTVSGRLRILVEHRRQEAGTLAAAVNEALADDFTNLNAACDAARAMDDARVPSSAPATTTSTTTDAPPSGTSGSLLEVGPSTLDTEPQSSRDEGGTGSELVREDLDRDDPPSIAPLSPTANVSLADMARHYHDGLGWALRGATFSAEFDQIRADPAAALDVLVQHGLDPGVADHLANVIAAVLAARNIPPTGEHVEGTIQNAVFDAIDPQNRHGTLLWGLLRYFNAQ